MFARLIAILHEYPLTSASFAAAWGKLIVFAAMFLGWDSTHQEAAQALGNDLASIALAVGALMTVCQHAVQVARQLFVAPAGHVIVPTAATQIAAAQASTAASATINPNTAAAPQGAYRP